MVIQYYQDFFDKYILAIIILTNKVLESIKNVRI